ncbi:MULTISPECIES: phosphopantetheine-binding protein [Streptomyces]|uniref:Carrier domain-containing protein n=1 Tax=Streptomyces albus (strain ATCC 21838 / DSM 41398 / FERM P-419 / JCM 4703 / NBRC 107858) TaxID=1081613 RepID=A0A0B5FA58_STRA4|nr:phosphopantetheine-binding protein [Streptomyces sp. SCSIO ZS0520]AJE87342.1 hypothetical protein SLNWT_6966 [Streptomyces albus]AOU81644.1 hypothetical protein SLNHY_6953 [Streptomyces albus]
MADALSLVARSLTEIRPDLGEEGTPITRESVLFYATDPGVPILGLDSMEALELLAILEEECDVQLADTGIRIAELHTVGDVVDALEKAL